MAKIGVTLTDVLRRAWTSPFTTKSDYARQHADTIAMAASDGLLTSRVATGLYGQQWLITSTGIGYVERRNKGTR